MDLKAVLFDLHGTLAYVKNPMTSDEISEFLLKRGYEIYPQSLDAASYYVSMIDYPKYGYKSWKAYLRQILRRLDAEVEDTTLQELALLYQKHKTYTLFLDAVAAVRRAKELNLKTAVLTTIAHFSFCDAVKPIRKYLDVITTGYEVGCEKSNPKMHKQTLEQLGVIPQEAVMIGDALLVDIKIPKNLGMHTIMLDRANKSNRKPKEADAIVSTLTEAIDTVEEWRSHT